MDQVCSIVPYAIWEQRTINKQSQLVIEPNGSIKILVNGGEVVKLSSSVIVWLWDTLSLLIAEGQVTKSAGAYGSRRRINEASMVPEMRNKSERE